MCSDDIVAIMMNTLTSTSLCGRAERLCYWERGEPAHFVISSFLVPCSEVTPLSCFEALSSPFTHPRHLWWYGDLTDQYEQRRMDLSCVVSHVLQSVGCTSALSMEWIKYCTRATKFRKSLRIIPCRTDSLSSGEASISSISISFDHEIEESHGYVEDRNTQKKEKRSNDADDIHAPSFVTVIMMFLRKSCEIYVMFWDITTSSHTQNMVCSRARTIIRHMHLSRTIVVSKSSCSLGEYRIHSHLREGREPKVSNLLVMRCDFNPLESEIALPKKSRSRWHR